MSTLMLVILGGIAGWIAARLMGTSDSQGIILNIIVGVIGAHVGGYIFKYLGYTGVTGFNVYSIAVAVVGSVVFIAILRFLRGK